MKNQSFYARTRAIAEKPPGVGGITEGKAVALIGIGLITLSLLMHAGCSTPKEESKPPAPFFARGADVSWLTEMEAAGRTFADSSGKPGECLGILKAKGVNSVRLRAFVQPADGWCNTKDLVAKAKRAQALGLKILIDFHYSDSWADHSKQKTPDAWNSRDLTGLGDALHSYTVGVMDTLKKNGITPEWVQIGNETNDGMLWETGRASGSISNFAALVRRGYKAVKSVSPSTQVVLHLANGYDSTMFRRMFDALRTNDATWDVIGMSVYPSVAPEGVWGWRTVNARCLNTMNFLIARYGTPVMVVEAGMPAFNARECQSFLGDLLAKTRKIPNHMGQGVFYTEPEAYSDWKGYKFGAFDENGKPTKAMDAFSH